MFKNVFFILVKWLFNKAKAMHKGIETHGCENLEYVQTYL